jgi:hypothetical protein
MYIPSCQKSMSSEIYVSAPLDQPDYFLTSGPFEVSMSAVARPKRWGVARQAKVKSSSPPRSYFIIVLYFRLISST